MASYYSDHEPNSWQHQGSGDVSNNTTSNRQSWQDGGGPRAQPSSAANPFGAGPSLAPSPRPDWAIADDVFWERYGTALRSTQDSWRSLPHLGAMSGQLQPTCGANSLGDLPDDFLDGPSTAIEPWLLQTPAGADSAVNGRTAPSVSRRRLLFQYKPYSQQDPVHLSEQDIASVLEAAFGKIPLGNTSNGASPSVAPLPSPWLASSPGGAGSPSPWGGSASVGGGGLGVGMGLPTSDVACVVLIKLIMDLYLSQGPQVTFSMVHFMLQRAVVHGDGAAKGRVFDLILNLAVHGELLYDAPADQVPEDDAAVVEAVARLDRAGPSADWRHTVTSALRASLAAGLDTPSAAAGTAADDDGAEWPPLPRPAPIGAAHGVDPRGQRFRQWLRLLLFRMLSVLCSVPNATDAAWAAAASCLSALATHEGSVVRSFVEELPLESVSELLQQSREQAWPEALRCWLSVLAANLLYRSKMTSANSSSSNTASFINGLDHARLQAFGGIHAVVEGYIHAPTLRSQRAFFCVMFDYLTGPGARQGEDPGLEASLAQVRSLIRAVHRSQIDAIGAALFYSRAAEALHPVLQFPNTGLEDTAAVLSAQLAAAQTAHPQSIVQPPPDLLEQCLQALHRMVTASTTGGGSTAAVSLSLSDLVNALKESSSVPGKGASQGESTLARLLIEAADQEVIRAAMSGMPFKSLLPLPRPQGSRTSPSPPLKAPSNAQNATGGLECVAEAVAEALPDPRGNAALAFAHAVHALLDYAQLSATGLADSGTDRNLSSAWLNIDFPALALNTLTLAMEWLSIAPPAARQRAAVVLAERAVSTLTVRYVDPTYEQNHPLRGSHSNININNLNSRSGNGLPGQNNMNATSFSVGSASKAPSPLSLDSAGGRHGGDTPETPSTPPPGHAAPAGHAGLAPSSRPPSPLAKFAPVPKLAAAWRRLTAPHGATVRPGAVDDLEPEVRPLSAGLPALKSGSQQHGGATGGSGSPSQSAASHQDLGSQGSAAYHAQQAQQLPRRSLTGGPTLLGLAAQRVTAERQATADAAKGRAIALSLAETKLTAVESFLSGLSLSPPAMLQRVPPTLLRTIFAALRPDLLPGGSGGPTASGSPPLPPSSARVSPGGPSAGPGSIRLSPAQVQAQARLAAVQAGRPAWDVRAAIAILLLQQQQLLYLMQDGNKNSKSGAGDGDGASIDSSFLAALLSDSDPRVRRHVSSFILARFAQRQGQQYRNAVREVVAKAQRADDERLLRSPEAQVIAMLEARLVTLEGLM